MMHSRVTVETDRYPVSSDLYTVGPISVLEMQAELYEREEQRRAEEAASQRKRRGTRRLKT